jgi:hypothetical protein
MRSTVARPPVGPGGIAATDCWMGERAADTIISQAKRVVVDASSPRSGTDDVTESLARLGELRDKGVLTEDEFAQQKARLLQSGS